jgi:hypothetical protein
MCSRKGDSVVRIVAVNRKTKFEKLLHDLKVGVLGQIIGFAAGVAEEIDSFAARRLFGLSSEGPSYARQFSNGPPKTSTTHVNQLLLCVEALSFFWHAIDRLSFHPNNEALRAAILDPVAISLSEMLAEVLNKRGMNTTGTDQLIAVQGLSLRYAEAPTLIGTSAQDNNCALHLAARAILEDAGLHAALAPLMVLKLTEGLVALDLAHRIKALEAVL